MTGKPGSKRGKPRIVIADDHDCFTQILKLALEGAGMEVVKTAATGCQAVEATLQCKPDCLLLDIAMPDMDGLAALANIKFLAPETRVIVVSALQDPRCRTRALELGANAFFSKEGSMDDLISLIYTLVSGECLPAFTKPTAEPIFPTAPRFKLILEDQKPSAA